MILFENLLPVLEHFMGPCVDISHFKMILAEIAHASREEEKLSSSSWKVGTFSSLKLLINVCLAKV